MSFDSAIREVWSRDPEGGAVEFEGSWFPWRGIARAAHEIEAALARAQVPEQAVIGLVARNRTGPVIALAALLGLRRCVAMIYSAQDPEAIGRDLASLDLAAVLADERDWSEPTIAAARKVGTHGFAATSDPERPIVPVSALEGSGRDRFRTTTGDVALEMLSSGTTGPPKRIPLSVGTFEQAAADASKIYVAGSGRPPTSVVFHPICNIAGITFLVPMLFFGQPVCLLERFDLATWLAAVERHRPVRVSLPPTVLKQILEMDVPREALACLEVVGVGAAVLDPDLQEQFEEQYGIPLLISYGATEFGGVVANWSLDLHRQYARAKRGSVGRARPGCALRIVESGESGAVLAPGGVGLLEVRADRLGGGWVRTTDLASLDADGFLFLHGRADAAINRGGFKVSPDKVAAALRRHPAVRDAAVVGIADGRLGEVPAAAVELTEDAVVDEDELREHARRELLAYEVPTVFRTVDRLPRNASMKVDLRALRSLFTPDEQRA